jgi:hypothetical protein
MPPAATSFLGVTTFAEPISSLNLNESVSSSSFYFILSSFLLSISDFLLDRHGPWPPPGWPALVSPSLQPYLAMRPKQKSTRSIIHLIHLGKITKHFECLHLSTCCCYAINWRQWGEHSKARRWRRPMTIQPAVMRLGMKSKPNNAILACFSSSSD